MGGPRKVHHFCDFIVCVFRRAVGNDPRIVKMVKTNNDPIGIAVSGGDSGGIFVSYLAENSLAAKAGLEYGDQLLEVC